MGSQNGSKDSNIFKDAYFTQPSDVEWCLEKLDAIYGLAGKTALEPSVGSGVFPSAAPQLHWTTNELFPEFAEGFVADLQIDFAKGDRSDVGQFDFVIGNPPYGKASNLAKCFLLNSLEHSNVVAMVLPKAMRRHTGWDRWLPDDCKVMVDEPLPNSSFSLPDGRTKEVGTFFLVIERIAGYSRGKLLDPGPIGYLAEAVEFRPRRGDAPEKWWPEWATHGICLWGSAGKMFGRERSKTMALTLFVQLTSEQEDVVRKIDWEPLAERTKTSTPMISGPEAITEINKALANVPVG